MVPRSNKRMGDFAVALPARRTDFGKRKCVHPFQKSLFCLLSQFKSRFVLFFIASHFSRCSNGSGANDLLLPAANIDQTKSTFGDENKSKTIKYRD
jgi:hypothetical protein